MMKNNKKLEIYFPGWTRKSLTFTIDDGNIEMDTKFLSIIKPSGIKGTFNLCKPDRLSPEEYREFYKGYEIANHCKNHPMAFVDGNEYIISDEPFDTMSSAEYTEITPYIYKTETEGIYMMHHLPHRPKPTGWFRITDTDTYLKFVSECRTELEQVFGCGKIKSFVWPYSQQNNRKIFETLKSSGYNSIRSTGEVGSSGGFGFPPDRMTWSYTATNKSLLSLMDEYEKYEDDGELKFFAFGVHSYDFERDGNWCDLETFAEKYGNRPNDFYYATVSELFEYEDAVKNLKIEENGITNDSSVELYIAINGENVILNPRTTLKQ